MPRPRRTVALLTVVAALMLTLALPVSATASTRPSPPPRDLPARVDTSPDRLRFITTAASVAAVGVLAAAAALISGRSDRDD